MILDDYHSEKGAETIEATRRNSSANETPVEQ